MAIDSDAALGQVQQYAADHPSSTLSRYAKTSAEFSSVGGAVGSVVPGVGTAIGALGGAAAGAIYEGAQDLIAALKGPKKVRESAREAETAFYTYDALGAEKLTGLPYIDWWKLYVEAGRPPLEVIQAGQRAQRAAAKLAKRAGQPPPPPPPPPRTRARARASTASRLEAPPRDLEVLIATPSGLASTGHFGPGRTQGFRISLNDGSVVSGRWSAT